MQSQKLNSIVSFSPEYARLYVFSSCIGVGHVRWKRRLIPSPGALTATPNRLILLRSRYLSQAFAGVAVNAPGEGIEEIFGQKDTAPVCSVRQASMTKRNEIGGSPAVLRLKMSLGGVDRQKRSEKEVCSET